MLSNSDSTTAATHLRSGDQPVRIAVIGFAGVIGRRHTAHVLSNKSAILVAVVDAAPDASEVAAQLAPGVPFYRSVAEMLEAFTFKGNGKEEQGLEAAIVCTPNAYHVPVALELVDAGMQYLLVEKPLADTKAAGRLLVDHAREKGVKILVGHHRRFNPYVLAAKKVLSSPKPEGGTGAGVGKVKAVSGLWTAYKPEEYFAAGSWRRSRKLGGGPVMINFVHEVDVLQYLLGPIVRVSAEKMDGDRGFDNGDGDGDDEEEENVDRVETGAALTLRFASGVVGAFVLSDAVVSPHFFEAGTGENPMLPRALRPLQRQQQQQRQPDGSSKESESAEGQRQQQQQGESIDVYRVFGTHGTLSIPDMTLWTYGSNNDNNKDKNKSRSWENEMRVVRMELDDDDPRVPFDRQLDHFISVIRGDVEIGDGPGCTGEEGLRVLAVCEAVLEALDDREGGKRIVVDKE